MIREASIDDIKDINMLLYQFDYKIDSKSFNNPFFKSFVYEDDSIVGVIIYNEPYDRIEIDYIAVDENYKNKGIGSQLLKKIENNNIKNITLEVRQSNEVAINFYKKNGYKIVTIRKNYYNNEDGYLMLKEKGE